MSVFLAFQDNQCQISAWKVMNKPLAVVLTARQMTASVCVCVRAYGLFVYCVPYEVKARRG